MPAKPETVLARHHDVEHDEVDGRRPERPARGGGAVGDGDAHTVLLQIPGQGLANIPAVVDHENVRRRFHMQQLTRLVIGRGGKV